MYVFVHVYVNLQGELHEFETNKRERADAGLIYTHKYIWGVWVIVPCELSGVRTTMMVVCWFVCERVRLRQQRASLLHTCIHKIGISMRV